MVTVMENGIINPLRTFSVCVCMSSLGKKGSQVFKMQQEAFHLERLLRSPQPPWIFFFSFFLSGQGRGGNPPPLGRRRAGAQRESSGHPINYQTVHSGLDHWKGTVTPSRDATKIQKKLPKTSTLAANSKQNVV